MPTPTEPVEEQQEDVWAEDEGGPVKSFLEHLEDLRWVLIKCGAAVMVLMIVCLIGAQYVVEVMKYPLKRAHITLKTPPLSLTCTLGTNKLGTFSLQTNRIGTFDFGTNRHIIFELQPMLVSETNWVLGVQARPVSPREIEAEQIIELTTLGPAAAFFVAFKVALFAGLVIASPFLFFFIGGFVFPALKMHEKKHVYRGMGVGVGLFLAGVSFCYFALMPVALKASAQYSEWLGFSVTQWRAEEYLGFVSKFMLGMGLGFEMPVVLLTLVKIGVLDYRKLASFRRYMIVINLILGAVLTTPEVITQILMFFPLQILYEISVWVAWYWERQDKKKAALERVRT
jgi:sec-independent protein translocase protein TatC